MRFLERISMWKVRRTEKSQTAGIVGGAIAKNSEDVQFVTLSFMTFLQLHDT